VRTLRGGQQSYAWTLNVQRRVEAGPGGSAGLVVHDQGSADDQQRNHGHENKNLTTRHSKPPRIEPAAKSGAHYPSGFDPDQRGRELSEM
jgi:hypothetical protein